MKMGQAIGSFRLSTGRDADPARMTVHFNRLQFDKETAREAGSA